MCHLSWGHSSLSHEPMRHCTRGWNTRAICTGMLLVKFLPWFHRGKVASLHAKLQSRTDLGRHWVSQLWQPQTCGLGYPWRWCHPGSQMLCRKPSASSHGWSPYRGGPRSPDSAALQRVHGHILHWLAS